MSAHRQHEGWSGSNPIPKVSLTGIVENIVDPRGATESKAKKAASKQKSSDEARNQRTTDQVIKGAEVQVKDPVTGDTVVVTHASDAHDTVEDLKNVLDMDLPPPDWKAHNKHAIDLTLSTALAMCASYIALPAMLYFIPLPWIGRHPLAHLMILLIPPTVISYFLSFRLKKKISEDFDIRVWHSERLRGECAGEDVDNDGTVEAHERLKESAEWLNTLLKGVWPIINPDMFMSMTDMLEDIMQSSVPSFVNAVRVADLGLGSNSMRINSIRSLPDVDRDNDLQDLDQADQERLDGHHINVEISFSYKAIPTGSSLSSKAQNPQYARLDSNSKDVLTLPSLMLEFYVGMKGLWDASIPVWAELTGVSGTARARLELIPDPPFIKTTLLTLMGLPKVSISVIPMSKALPNVMNIPFLSQFVSSSIDAAAAEYVAPKSMILDLQQLISGDDIKKDTEAVGVILIHLHRVVGIKKADSTGSSDPYVTVCFSRMGKPLFSTRLVQTDLNPVFEESTAVVVRQDIIKLRDTLSLQLWDSDRSSADDILGTVEVDILELMRSRNQPSRRSTHLREADGSEGVGTLEYTCGFYGKMWPNEQLKTDGGDPGIPEDLRQSEHFKDARSTALNDLEAAVLVTPPDHNWPSGILSVQVHEIQDLTVKSLGRETRGLRNNDKGQDDSNEDVEQGEKLPSSYCTIAINDETVYTTRVKPVSSIPIFNAGTERFIRDWRQAHVNVVVRDSRKGENDPVLGLVFLKLSDLFRNASEITRFYPITNGIGYGSIRISVLFRPVEMKLIPALLGFDTGTLEITKVRVKASGDASQALSKCSLQLRTSTTKAKLQRQDDGKADDTILEWRDEEPTALAVRKRYSSALRLSFKSGVIGSGRKAMAMLWLRDIVDGTQQEIPCQIFQADDYNRLKQNYVPANFGQEGWASDDGQMKVIGTATIHLTFNAGLSSAHRKALKSGEPQKRRTWDEFERREADGLTQDVGKTDADHARPDNPNTEVPENDVHVEKEHGSDQEASNDEEGDDSKSKNPLKKLKAWREDEHALHREHRGIMQTKPARTAEWLADNVEEGVHKLKGHFAAKTREPDIETEA